MRHRVNLLVPPVVLLLAACGKGDTAAKGERIQGGGTTAEVPPATGAAATTIHLVIQSGPHAGTYDAESQDITCSSGIAGPNTWANQYSVTGKKPNEFSSLQLMVDGKDAADGTDEFLMTVGFGQLMKEGYSEHLISTQKDSPKKGSGTLQVEDRKTQGKVTFKGKAEDGATLEGTIDCHQVLRAD
jgi:hypothetical protein